MENLEIHSDFLTGFEDDPKVTVEVYTSRQHTELSLIR